MNSELDDVDVRGTIVAVLLASEDRDEIVGALVAIAWLAPAATSRRSPAALRARQRARRAPARDDPDPRRRGAHCAAAGRLSGARTQDAVVAPAPHLGGRTHERHRRTPPAARHRAREQRPRGRAAPVRLAARLRGRRGARGGSQHELADRDITAHPELKLARWAGQELDGATARATTMYTSCEPCPMCRAAIDRSGLGRVVFALSAGQWGAIVPASAGAAHDGLDLLANAVDEHSAVPGLLEALTRHLGWDVAELWMPDDAGERLVAAAAWRREPGPAERLRAHARRAHVRDGRRPRRPRVGAAHARVVPRPVRGSPPAAPPRGGASPACAPRSRSRSSRGQEPVGVVLLVSRERREPELSMDRLLEAIASHIAQFVERRRAERRIAEQAADLAILSQAAHRLAAETDLDAAGRAVAGAALSLGRRLRGAVDARHRRAGRGRRRRLRRHRLAHALHRRGRHRGRVPHGRAGRRRRGRRSGARQRLDGRHRQPQRLLAAGGARGGDGRRARPRLGRAAPRAGRAAPRDAAAAGRRGGGRGRPRTPADPAALHRPHRRADRAGQPARVGRRARPASWPARGATASRCASPCSTSTASSASTTRRATRPATGCSPTSPAPGRRCCARPTCWPATAARSSRSLLPHCELDGAGAIVERLLAAVPGGQTASCGIAAVERRRAGEQLVARADAALYRAKRGGRARSRGCHCLRCLGLRFGRRRWRRPVSRRRNGMGWVRGRGCVPRPSADNVGIWRLRQADPDVGPYYRRATSGSASENR